MTVLAPPTNLYLALGVDLGDQNSSPPTPRPFNLQLAPNIFRPSARGLQTRLPFDPWFPPPPPPPKPVWSPPPNPLGLATA